MKTAKLRKLFGTQQVSSVNRKGRLGCFGHAELVEQIFYNDGRKISQPEFDRHGKTGSTK